MGRRFNLTIKEIGEGDNCFIYISGKPDIYEIMIKGAYLNKTNFTILII